MLQLVVFSVLFCTQLYKLFCTKVILLTWSIVRESKVKILCTMRLYCCCRLSMWISYGWNLANRFISMGVEKTNRNWHLTKPHSDCVAVKLHNSDSFCERIYGLQKCNIFLLSAKTCLQNIQTFCKYNVEFYLTIINYKTV